MPGLLMLGVSRRKTEPIQAIWGTVLMVGLVLAYGAVIVSLGLLVATWQRRLGRAIALNVTTYLAATVVWPTLLLANHTGDLEREFFTVRCRNLFSPWLSPKPEQAESERPELRFS